MLMKSTLVLHALILALAFSNASSARADDKETLADAAKSSFGTFRLVKRIEDGEKIPEDEIKDIHMTLSDGKWTASKNDEVFSQGTFKVVAVKDGVRQVEGTEFKGEHAGRTRKHISKQEGEKLTICHGPEGEEFPSEFASKPGSGCTLNVWMRVKE